MKFTLLTNAKFFMFQIGSSLYSSGNLQRIQTSYPKFRITEPAIPSDVIYSYPYLHLISVALARAGVGSPDLKLKIAIRNIEFLDNKTKQHIGDSNLISMSSVGLFTAREVKRRGNIFIVNRSSHHILNQKKILEDLAMNWSWDEPIPSKQIIERELEEYELADRIVVPSKASYDSFVGQGVDLKKVVINPFPLTKLPNPISEDLRRDILFVGNVTLQKGFHTLVTAFNSLNLLGVQLHVVGIYSKDFLKMLHKKGLNFDNIRFYGPVDSTVLKSMYGKMDLLVLPSIHDGWGMVVNEAMVHGCIPIVSSGAGSSDQIEQGVNGYVFESGNIDELKKCILQALGNKQLRVSLMNSIKTSKIFCRTWDDFCKVYLEDL